MEISFQSIRVATGSSDQEGALVLADSMLAAVLVQLSQDHEQDAGKWCVECGFGPLEGAWPQLFSDLEEAKAWLKEKLTAATASK